MFSAILVLHHDPTSGYFDLHFYFEIHPEMDY